MAVTRRTARRGYYPVICQQIFLEPQTSQQNGTSCQDSRLYSPPIDLPFLKKFLRQLTAPATGKPDWPWVITAKHFLHVHLAPKADPLLCTAFAKEKDEQHFIDIMLQPKTHQILSFLLSQAMHLQSWSFFSIAWKLTMVVSALLITWTILHGLRLGHFGQT
jgi:hypothetical protein